MNLEELFESIDADAIDGFVRDGEQENLHLDFKTVVSPELKHSDDKKNFAKALSGFANANGGILVWGVVTEKNDENVDCATALNPIERLALFQSKLETNTGQWVDPQVMGVRHRIIFAEGAADKGYAISFIPESEGGPHMSLQEYRYYTRSGDSFYKMTHSQVADRFFRKKCPKLKLYTTFSQTKLAGVLGSKRLDFEMIVGVENAGAGTAKYPFLSIRVHKPYNVSSYGLDGNRHEGLPRIPKGNFRDPLRWGAGSDIVVHPEGILEVTKIKAEIEEWNFDKGPDLVIEYEIAAEDMDRVRGTEVIELSKILERASSEA